MDSEGKNWNWTEAVEDYVEEGESDKAISLLETVISKLEKETGKGSSSKLVNALLDLSKLYFSKGFSIKADQTRHRALRVSQESQDHAVSSKGDFFVANEVVSESPALLDCDKITEGHNQDSSELQNGPSPEIDNLNENWETIADRAPDELLSPSCLPGVSNISLDDTPTQGPKRRGRGTFSYGRRSLYSDDGEDNNDDDQSIEEDSKTNDFASVQYGTRHAVVLSGFSPSTKTTDLERLLDKFKDSGFAIRWVNDTVALAVFRSPSIAFEACSSVNCSFSVRQLDESDELLKSIKGRDLEPPRPRPKTSARTAQRLIAQSMGIKLSSPTFGSRELRQQEAERKNRIISRQNMRDEAWGDDIN